MKSIKFLSLGVVVLVAALFAAQSIWGAAGVIGRGDVVVGDLSVTAGDLSVNTSKADTAVVLTLENTGGNVQTFITSASPEGAITASIGDIARDHTNGLLHYKHSGAATNTGWAEIAQAAMAMGFINIHDNATVLTIDTTSVEHGIRLFSSLLLGPDVTFDAGETGTITAISDAGGGDITVTATHSLAVGDIVSLSGGTGYDAVYVVQAIATTVSFDVTVAFVATGTGTYNEPSTFVINKTGTYKFDWSTSAQAATANKTYEWHVYVNATRQEHGAAKIRLSSTDPSLASGATFLSITSGDRVSMFVANLTDAVNLTHAHFDMNLHQI